MALLPISCFLQLPQRHYDPGTHKLARLASVANSCFEPMLSSLGTEFARANSSVMFSRPTTSPDVVAQGSASRADLHAVGGSDGTGRRSTRFGSASAGVERLHINAPQTWMSASEADDRRFKELTQVFEATVRRFWVLLRACGGTWRALIAVSGGTEML